MSSLWRTQRPRFPLYSSDGWGRDYYIKYTNGGYWEKQFQIHKKPDYERPHYNNFHTLFHAAAPFKYWGNGHGRETYILQTNGLFHNQKPLCAYKLSDFLRNNCNIKGIPNGYIKRVYMSVSEKKHNNALRQIEKKLIKRLYTNPMNERKTRQRLLNLEQCPTMPSLRNTYSVFPQANLRNTNNIQYLEEEAKDSNNENNYCNSMSDLRNKNSSKKCTYNNTTSDFYKNCLTMNNTNEKYLLDTPMAIKTESDFIPNNGKKIFKEQLKTNKAYSYSNYNDPKYIDCRGKYNRTMTQNYKSQPRKEKPKSKYNKFRITH